jgi:hypothetical protein
MLTVLTQKRRNRTEVASSAVSRRAGRHRGSRAAVVANARPISTAVTRRLPRSIAKLPIRAPHWCELMPSDAAAGLRASELCIASGTTSVHAGVAAEVVTRMVVYGHA